MGVVRQVAGFAPGRPDEEADTSVRLLRHHEEQGLLASHRLAGGHRRYDADAPAVVRRIRALLDAGLPTRTIRDLLPTRGPASRPCSPPSRCCAAGRRYAAGTRRTSSRSAARRRPWAGTTSSACRTPWPCSTTNR
ncbi:MerR family transcriptional regulator [Streptomyces sp. CB02460]|uniref:MerR family transcriptional regulator n=1 Tax=Streptomyces sp. CB02460 TaxID=1703941 RepID=UPI003FD51558